MDNLKERLEQAGALPDTVTACLRIYDHLGRLAAHEEPERQTNDLARRDFLFERLIAVAGCGDERAYVVRYYAGFITKSVGIAFQQLVDGLRQANLGDLRLVPDGQVFANWNQLLGWKQRCYRHLP